MKKERKKLKVKLLVFSIIVLILIIYAICSLVGLIKNPTDTFMVEQGEISFEETVHGYVIRDETVIQGENYKNGISQIKSEGEKVSKGEAIYRYYTNGEEGLLEKINELDVKIRETMEKETNLYSSDIKALDIQIQKKVYEIGIENNLQKIKEYKTELNTLITKKAKIAGELSPSGSYLKQLIEERSKYENELNGGSEYIKSPSAGVVSYRVDGLEEVLTTSNVAGLSKEMLEDLKLKTGEIVATSMESGKIVDNFYCYIACILKNENLELSKKEVGKTIKIRLLNTEIITATIEYISQENENESLVVFKIDKGVEELINYRKISLDIIWWSENGLKVPNSAIKHEENGLAYITRKRVGYTDDIYIKILKQTENYSIIENYTANELKELKVAEEKIKNRRTISIYDELEK